MTSIAKMNSQTHVGLTGDLVFSGEMGVAINPPMLGDPTKN